MVTFLVVGAAPPAMTAGPAPAACFSQPVTERAGAVNRGRPAARRLELPRSARGAAGCEHPGRRRVPGPGGGSHSRTGPRGVVRYQTVTTGHPGCRGEPAVRVTGGEPARAGRPGRGRDGMQLALPAGRFPRERLQ